MPANLRHKGQLLSFAEQVVLGNLKHTHDAVNRAVAGPDTERTRGALLNLHVEVDLVLYAAGFGVDEHILEKTKLVDVLSATVDCIGIVESALKQSHFTADNIIAGFRIAADADFFKVDFIALLNTKRYIYRFVLRLYVGLGRNVGEGESF